jgi:DNA-binding transcriptional ArsR family regulator
VPSRLAADRLQTIEALRRLRMTAAEIAEVLKMALSTVSRWLARIGLGKRGALEPPEPPNRYERKRPGEPIHVDVKKLGKISARGAGHRVTGNRKSQFELGSGAKRRRKTGWEFVHVCVDDATRLACVEVLPDEKGATAAGFLRRALRWFKGMGVQVEGVDIDRPLGLRRHLRVFGRANRSAIRLARPLQLQEKTRLPRSSTARSPACRAGTTLWVTTASARMCADFGGGSRS